MRTCVKTLLLSLFVGLSLTSCTSKTGRYVPGETLPTVGELYELVLDSSGQDTDGDGIPDDVEQDPRVGTDPDRADSDGDGRNDCFEVFGRSFLFVVTEGQSGELYEGDRLLDADRDGMTAPIDAGELAEEYMVDSDLDGVYDYLEFYGYVYHWPTAEFRAWTEADRAANPDTPWYRTDPLQYSTDQDAYSDGMEVSGVRMDVAVLDPGRDPLVPATPNIVVRLEGYAVTLNEDVTYERGGSIERGQSWSRETEGSYSFGWSTGGELGVETGKEETFKFLVHYNQSWGIEGSNTTTTSVGVGSSINEEINWNQARCYNTTEAAHLKLFLKVENHGTAPASNIVPTVSLRIGGANVATFQQPGFNIHILMPGEVFPDEADVYWVVDSTGGGPLALTEHELKALEGGAPVSISVPQLSADVMMLSPDGVWEPAGDVNQYTARCEAVGANLFADLGKGAFLHQWVYAGEGPTAPAVTLGDALRRTFGLTESDGEWTIEYVDGDGVRQTADLSTSHGDGWTIHVDPDTFNRIEPDEDPFEVRLIPGSHVELIPPRDSEHPWPTVFSAYATPLDEGYDVVACAYDYDGIEKVEFVDRDGLRTPMEPDGRGPWFFSCRVSDEYDFTEHGIETIEVTSINGDVPVAIHPVAVVYTVESIPPLITRILFDANRGVLKTKVEAGGDLPQDAIDWVRLYHEDFRAAQTNEERDGYITMVETVNWFEDPYVYECELPNDVVPDHARIVAKTEGGLYSASGVAGMDTLRPWRMGSETFRTYVETVIIVGTFFQVPRLDADTGWKSVQEIPVQNQNTFDGRWEIAGDWQQQIEANTWLDVYYCSNLSDGNLLWFYPYAPYFGFPHGAARLDTSQSDKSPLTQYVELGRNDIEDLIDTGAIELVVNELWTFGVGEVFIFETSEGRYGKLIVTSYKAGRWMDSDSTANAEYVVFRKPGDYSGPPPPIEYHEPAPYYELGKKITPNYPIAQGSGEWPDYYYLVSPPSLPAGLELAVGSGVISGTPTQAIGPTTYTIGASNPAGTTTCTVTITVRQAPSGLTYNVAPSYDIGQAVSIPSPTWTGDANRFQVSPALPEGLVLNQDNGVISGTPTEVTAATTYTITASNETGASTGTTIEFATALVAPEGLSYSFEATYTVGDEILESAPEEPTLANPVVQDLDDYPLTYSFEAGGTVPGDFTINSGTGAIYGALNTAGAYSFTVVVENDAGSDEYDVSFTVSP